MKSQQNDVHKIINELRRDMTEYFEIIIRRLSRIRALEERLDMIEEDVTDMRSKIRRLESFLKEIIEKEKYIEEIPRPIYTRPKRTFEISGITMERTAEMQRAIEEKKEIPVKIPSAKPKEPVRENVKTTSVIEKLGNKEVTSQITETNLAHKLSELTQTEKQIIKVLIKYPNLKGGTSIARKIGKAREHTCRLLKKLAERGLLIRDESVWPYAYKVPERIKQLIMLEEELGYV